LPSTEYVATNISRQQVALGDVGGKRYSYATVAFAQNVTGLMAFNAALSSHLNSAFRLDTANQTNYLRQLSDPAGPWKYFQCTATDSGDKARKNSAGNFISTGTEGAVISIGYDNGFGDYMWWVEMDYVLNEGVLGFHADPRFRRLRGKLSAVKSPDRTFLMVDGQRAEEGEDGIRWLTIRPADGSVRSDDGDDSDDSGRSDSPAGTEARAYTLGEHFATSYGRTHFDLRRHRGRANVLFVDGHVETRMLDAKDLAGVFILPPVR
jgi:prepilin-type processing-associated H-X9-DG protein